jgi:putative ABC transport system substrate-binding protein
MPVNIGRRDFISLLSGAAVTWPLAARAQQLDQMRRIGVLMGYAESDLEAQAWVTAFVQGFKELGWIVGRNVSIVSLWRPRSAIAQA